MTSDKLDVIPMATNTGASTSGIPNTSAVVEDVTPKPIRELRNRCRKDFLFLEELGEGSFSTVFLAKELETNRKFAVKVCYKAQIVREKKVAQIFREKDILQMLSTRENAHPFIVQLFCTFQDQDSLYFVLTLATRKDLLRCLRKLKRFNVPQTRFVVSELLAAIAHIHSYNVVHRDLKLENILLNDDGHILLSDFGCAKRLDESKPTPSTKNLLSDSGEKVSRALNRRSSFVGTSFYVSPEVLNGEEVDESCDYWTFGVIIFELLAGRRPFSDVSEYLTYQRILKLLYSFDNGFPPTESTEGADDLVRHLLVLDKTQRWGSEAAGGCELVKAHPFFAGVDWLNLTAVKSPLL